MRTKILYPPLVALVLVAAACGSSPDDADGVASLGDGTISAEEAADDNGLEAPEDIEEAMLLFQDCMEEHGVDLGNAVAVRVGDEAALDVEEGGDAADTPPPEEIDPEEMEAANEACQGHLANATSDFELTPEQQAAMEDAQLEWHQCMLDLGIELPEPRPIGDGSPGIHIEAGPADEDSPIAEVDPDEMNAAFEECQKVYDEYPELDGMPQMTMSSRAADGGS